MGSAYETANQGTKAAEYNDRSGGGPRLWVFVGFGSQYCAQREADRSTDYGVASATTIHPP
jgi:hypothetical protein